MSLHLLFVDPDKLNFLLYGEISLIETLTAVGNSTSCRLTTRLWAAGVAAEERHQYGLRRGKRKAQCCSRHC